MNGEYEDRILESGLEEVLGGQYPPDLSFKILQEWERREAAAADSRVSMAPLSNPIAGSVLPADTANQRPLIVDDSPAPTSGRLARSGSSRTRPLWSGSRVMWLTMSIAGGLLIAIGMWGIYWGRIGASPTGGLLVDSDRPSDSGSGQSGVAQREFGPLPHREMPLPWTPDEPGPQAVEGGAAAIASREPDQPLGDAPAVASNTARAVRPTPSEDSEVIAFINTMLTQQWRQRGITPAPPPDEKQWCQRIYQRLVGREPSADELRQFLSSSRNNRRVELVDRLLSSDDYAQHWSAVWTDVLLGLAAEDPQPLGIDRQGLEQFLASSLQENKPYDRLAAELLTATGSCDPESSEFNGAANFLAASGGNGSIAATDRISRVFLGKQLICARCHNDPTSGWKQDEFWRLTAFFQQMKVRRNPEEAYASLVDEDFHGGTGIPKDAEIFFPGADGRLRLAYPEFGFESIPRSGLLSDVNRRHELTRLLTRSPDFRSATVNRVWAGLLRYGFVEPMDDAGPHNRPSHPELLDGLSEQLAAHDFDLKRLIRWIVLSQAFDVSDQRTPESWMDAPEKGGTPLFARFYTEPPRSIDLHKELMLAVRTRPSGSALPAQALARMTWTPDSPTVPQIIDTQGTEVMIGPPWLEQLAASRMPPKQKVEHLFRAVLDREPTDREATAARLVLADRMNDQVAVRELWQILSAGRNRSTQRFTP
jgi:hypothetical protein